MDDFHAEFQRQLMGRVGELVRQPDVTEVILKGPEVYVERSGRLEHAGMTYPGGPWRLLATARNIAEMVGRPLDEEHPILDARLVDGSRVHIVIPPCAKQVQVNIRPFRRAAARLADLEAWGMLTPQAATFLRAAVAARRNVVIAGPTGAGKSTVLNALAGCVPPDERIVVIEDTTELNLSQPHVVSLEASPPGVRGRSLSIRDLFVAALRMRPDRILIGEVRRGEALDVAQAMLSGHSGVMTTVHADSPRAALTRLETLCLMADVPLPLAAVRRQLAAIHLFVQVTRDADGRRRVSEIAELVRAGARGYRLSRAAMQSV